MRKPSSPDLYLNTGATIISFFVALISGEMLEGVSFLLSQGDFFKYLSFFSFCTFGFFASVCGTALTKQFGALVLGITSNARKAVTLALSFILFPERNVFTTYHLVGSIIFFSGLVFRTVSKNGPSKKNDPFDSGRDNLLPLYSPAANSLAAFGGVSKLKKSVSYAGPGSNAANFENSNSTLEP